MTAEEILLALFNANCGGRRGCCCQHEPWYEMYPEICRVLGKENEDDEDDEK